MKKLKYLIIHCSATPPSMDVKPDDIRRWHKARGWKQVGYADFIDRQGMYHNLVPYNKNEYVEGWEITNGAKGYNNCSRHICLAGGVSEEMQPENNFTSKQMEVLVEYVKMFIKDYPDAKVIGHNEVAAKACPSFDVKQWLKDNGL